MITDMAETYKIEYTEINLEIDLDNESIQVISTEKKIEDFEIINEAEINGL